ncbi:hypothetical protein CYMTET_21309 [Cymbomonas tetramitiformis]|uniref:K Homology domain-containing protein n=1 Tax=Cymbomonas tetramitiformis TaxID=36881 RepID=A0AAE0G297_9CHLO|nr:hypothetical protein CYMTET_21309 [Cymbomonas tetramitiformis]
MSDFDNLSIKPIERGKKGRDRDDWGVDYLTVSDSDAAFILGKGGRTKEKIARVSGAKLDMNEREGQSRLEIRGTALERRKTLKYVKCVMAQRVGPVHVEDNDEDDDLTLVEVPTECIGFVTGKQGNFLRTMEDEWGVIMFFAEFRGPRSAQEAGGVEKLAMFGPKMGRRGAELKVLSAIEQKIRGYCTKHLKDTLCDEEWGTDLRWLPDDMLSYALGKKGLTRKKLARASGCIVEYVGNVVHMSGNRRQRERAREYLDWLFKQLDGPVHVDIERRNDASVVDVPTACVGYVTGNRRETLGKMEEEWGVLMFFLDSFKDDRREHRAIERLAIFGPERARRGAELKVMSAVEAKEPGCFTRGVREKRSQKHWGTDTLLLSDTELAYALGRGGTTRRKLARASGCIIEFLGHVAFMAGTKIERQRARRYCDWLLSQRSGGVTIEGASSMDDCQVVHVPQNCMGHIAGNRGANLRQLEEETGTYCFFARDGREAALRTTEEEAVMEAEVTEAEVTEVVAKVMAVAVAVVADLQTTAVVAVDLLITVVDVGVTVADLLQEEVEDMEGMTIVALRRLVEAGMTIVVVVMITAVDPAPVNAADIGCSGNTEVLNLIDYLPRMKLSPV